MSRILSLLAIVTLLVAAVFASAERFGSININNNIKAARFAKHRQQRHQRKLSSVAGTAPTLLFNKATGSQIYTTPVVVGSNIFVGNDKGQLVNIHTSGLTNWTFTATVPTKDNDQQDRIYSEPTLAASQQALFVADSTGTLYNVDLASGSVDYTFDLNGNPVMAKPLVVGTSNVVVATYSGVVYNFNISGNGAQSWNYTTGDFVSADPLLTLAGDGSQIVLIASHGGYIHALDANTGTLIYKASTESFNAIPNSCVQDSARFVYCNVNGGEVFKMNATNGDFVWKIKVTGSPSARPVLSADESTIYFPTDFTKMVAVATSTGVVNWRFDAKDYVLRTAAAVNPNNGNVIFGAETPFFSTTPGVPTIFSVDGQSGQQVWQVSNGTSGDSISTGIYVDASYIIAGTQNGNVMAYTN